MRITTCAVAIVVCLVFPAAYSQSKGSRNNPFRKFVTALPSVDRVEVTRVTPLLTNDVKNVDCTKQDFICSPDGFPYKAGTVSSLTGEDADKISGIWRKLEREFLHNEDKCLPPDHVLRFYQGNNLLLETQVCTMCRKVTLPIIGVVSVAGSNDAPYYLFQEYLIPDSSFDLRRENFKRDMMPKVGQRFTVIGLLGGSKPAMAVEFGEGAIYLYGVDLARENELYNLGCHTAIKVTCTLRHFPEPPLHEGPPVQTPREHFYFEKPDIEVMRVARPPRSKRRRR